jgi:hypothetical protein
MENAKGTPAVEAKAESTNQIAVSHSLEIALSLRKKFCSPRFSKGSLFSSIRDRRLLRSR